MKVSIDKISLIHTITDIEHYKTIITYMHVFKSEYTGKGKYYWKTEYCTKVNVKLDEQCYLHIVAGITHGQLYARFEFNVAKLSKDGWEELYLIFVHLFEDGYKTAYENLRVDYMEIAVDFKGIEFSQINVIDNRVKEFNEDKKSDGSIYYGAKKSKRGFIIYDKAKQLMDDQNLILGYPLLRVESRLRLPKIKVKDMAGIKNPFLPLRIFDVSKNPTNASGPLWKKYRNLVETEGLDAQAAYLLFNPIERQALDLRIALRRHEWWEPKKAWELAIKEFATLTPQNDIYTV